MITDSEYTCGRGIEETGIGSVGRAMAVLEDNGILNHEVKRKREKKRSPFKYRALLYLGI